MPLSNKERSARHRAKIKADPAARTIHLAERRERWRPHTPTSTHTEHTYCGCGCGRALEVSCMQQLGKRNVFTWPHPPDKIFYFKSDVLHKVSEPEPLNSRRSKLMQDDWKSFQTCTVWQFRKHIFHNLCFPQMKIIKKANSMNLVDCYDCCFCQLSNIVWWLCQLTHAVCQLA